MSDRPTVETLVRDFEVMSASEKAAVLRFMASEQSDPRMRERLIMAALRMDAIAMMTE